MYVFTRVQYVYNWHLPECIIIYEYIAPSKFGPHSEKLINILLRIIILWLIFLHVLTKSLIQVLTFVEKGSFRFCSFGLSMFCNEPSKNSAHGLKARVSSLSSLMFHNLRAMTLSHLWLVWGSSWGSLIYNV